MSLWGLFVLWIQSGIMSMFVKWIMFSESGDSSIDLIVEQPPNKERIQIISEFRISMLLYSNRLIDL